MKIYLDLDGPILNPKKRYWLAHIYAISTLGGKPFGDQNSYWQQKQQFTPKKLILTQCMLDPQLEREYTEQYAKKVENLELLKKDRLQVHARAVLFDLSKQHQLIAVSARAVIKNTLSQLESLKIKTFFSSVLVAGIRPGLNQHLSKADLIRQEAASTGLLGQILIGDTEAEIQAAKILGIRSVVVTNGIRSKNYLKDFHPDFIIQGIHQLPQILLSGSFKT